LNPKKARKRLANIEHKGIIEEPEALLRQAICSKCGSITILDGGCVPCAERRRRAMEIQAEADRIGYVRPQPDPVRQEYERIFLCDPPLEIDRQRLLHTAALSIALKEIRNCYTKNSEGKFEMPAHNAERHQRILKGIDILLRGFVGKTLGRTVVKELTILDALITGQLGTTWHN